MKWNQHIIQSNNTSSKVREGWVLMICCGQTLRFLCSGCGSAGKAVASNTRSPWFESSHQQNFLYNMLNVEKTKTQGSGMDHLKNVNLNCLPCDCQCSVVFWTDFGTFSLISFLSICQSQPLFVYFHSFQTIWFAEWKLLTSANCGLWLSE